MHAAGPQICQIDRWNNSFQNMHGMLWAKIDRLASKIDFVQKNTSKMVIFVCTNLSYLTMEGPI